MPSLPPKTVLTVRKRDNYTCQICGRSQGEMYAGPRTEPKPLFITLFPQYDPADDNPDHYRVICWACWYKIRFGMMPDPDGKWHTEEMYPGTK